MFWEKNDIINIKNNDVTSKLQQTVVHIHSVNSSRPDPGLREKINLNFIFTLLCSGSKGFMKALKAFIKPFETPQRSVKKSLHKTF